jgi:hypothetical protein
MKHTPLRAGSSLQRDLSREEFWRRTLADFAVSDQSVRAFCAARQVSEPSFYSWRRTLQARDAASSKSASAGLPGLRGFLPVRLTGADGERTSRIEIVLGGGTRIRLRPPVDRAALAEVLAALGWAQGQEA